MPNPIQLSISPDKYSALSPIFENFKRCVGLFICSLVIGSCGSAGGGGGSGSGGGGGGSGSGVGGVVDGGVGDNGNNAGGNVGGDDAGGDLGIGGNNGGNGGGIGGEGGDGGGPLNLSLFVPGNNRFSNLPFNATFSGAGEVQLDLEIGNLNAFQVVTRASGRVLSTRSLEAPDGTVLVSFSDDPLKTGAVFASFEVNTLNYQTRSADPVVTPGNYSHRINVAGGSGSDFGGHILSKNDPDLSTGNLVINVHLVGNEAQKESTRQAIQNALDLAQTILNQAGIISSFISFDVSSDSGVVPNPSNGSGFYQAQGAVIGAAPRALNLYIAEDISADGTTNPGNTLPGVLGITSGIPGPAIVTTYSAVAISLATHQGPDGFFGAAEQTLLAETIAHEGGHYLGLFHPNENNFATFDPLEDTPECTSITDCNQKEVTSNLMFFTAVSGVRQQTLTANQAGVLNRNLLVD